MVGDSGCGNDVEGGIITGRYRLHYLKTICYLTAFRFAARSAVRSEMFFSN
jgi:hypothetical protein